MFKNKDYSLLSKILHHLVLGSNFVPEMLHDIEVALFKNKIVQDNLKAHIFVCGLPRSGTTILMRSIYETKHFASLTYRDMPFVIIPNIWSKISNRIKPDQKKERAHEDKISINIDSPEALEEIFWKIKLQKNYIFSNKLIPHKADEFTIEEFKNFVSLILYKYKKKNYLSKNNNNLLRLESIIQAFPNCLILIPFRDPIQQAHSLLTQHKNFINLKNKDKFIKKYMSYLAHHEFGGDHRPYEFDQNFKSKYDSNCLEYWLDQWINAYNYLTQERFYKKTNVMYINYEYLCENPKIVFEKIFKRINLSDLSYTSSDNFKLSLKKVETKEDKLLLKANEIFKKLNSYEKN